MLLQNVITVLVTLSIAEELLGNPLKFPEETSVGQARGASSAEDIDARFHHHRKKKKKKPGCRQHRFKRADSQGRFFFPILNYYDTNVYVNTGSGQGEGPGNGCGSGLGGGGSVLPGLGGGLGSVGSGLGGGVGSLGSGLGSGLGGGFGSLGSGLGGGLGTLGSGIASNFPSIGSGIPSFGGTRPPSAPQSTRPPPILPPLATSRPPPLVTSRPPPPVTTLDPDNEDYDYSDFSTTTRTRPVNSLADYPVINSISNSIRPVFERPQRVFSQYVVRPINRTIQEFYSLF